MAPDRLPVGPPAEVQIAFLLTRLGGKQSNAFGEVLTGLSQQGGQQAAMIWRCCLLLDGRRGLVLHFSTGRPACSFVTVRPRPG